MSSIKRTWLYWLATAPFAITMLMAAVALLAGARPNVDGITHLGYPAYVCTILGVFKLLGGLAILIGRPRLLKEWAYAGYTFNLIGAAASHAIVGDSPAKIVTPLILLAFVLTSYALWSERMSSFAIPVRRVREGEAS